MARRKKTSPAEDPIERVAMLPWWADVALALLSYLLLHQVAAQPLTAPAPPGQVGAANRCANAGGEFRGCTGYPACHGTRPIG
jgi:hypothetical protein